MQSRTVLILTAVLATSGVSANSIVEDRQTKQNELNQRCEDARQAKIAPLKKKKIEACVEEGKKDREGCERFYHDYGAGNRFYFPLFYDIAECEEAEEFTRSYRRGG